MGSRTQLLKRYPGNPILTAGDIPYPAHTVFNPGATRLTTGETLLLCRVEDYRGMSHLTAVRSADGIKDWKVDPSPTLQGDPVNCPEEVWGIEDARITWLEELGKYAVTYTAYSHGGPCVALALTEDFKSFERMGVIMPAEDKDAVLLPHRVGPCWALIHRPVTTLGWHIWISYSPDLRHWGSHKIILTAREGAWWDSSKIGISCPVIETPEGWLMIYHGVRETPSGPIYRLGLALFDLITPEKCLLRGNEWIFCPEEDYEISGDVGRVIFPCGYTIGDDGDALYVYYGAADTCVALATGSLREMLDWLKEHGSTPPRTRS